MSLEALRRAALLDNASIHELRALANHRALQRHRRHRPDPSGTHPYRTLTRLETSDPICDCHEESVIYGLLVVIGIIPILFSLVDGASFEAQVTIGSVMVVGGILGLIRRARSRSTT